MEYRQLGRSGMRVSPVSLGTMSFGGKTDEAEAIRIVNEAIDLGVNFIDSADCYGPSEQYIGNALAENGRRDEVVLATKGVWKMGDGPNDWGASRYHLTRAVESSLRRLQTDRIDLYYLHVLDPTTPLEETLQTLDALVKQGKILYVGTSKWPATLIVEFLMLAKQHGWPQTVAEQPPYHLMERSLENDLAWMCLRHGIGLCTFSPLYRGVFSGKRSQEDLAPEEYEVVEKLRPLAEGKGCTVAEYTLAWVMQQPFITSAIVGCRTVEYVRSAVKACEVQLTPEELANIDEIAPPGSSLSGWRDRIIHAPARVAANAGKWRAHKLIDGSTPPGAERSSLG